MPFVACGDLCGYDADMYYDELQPPGARALPGEDVERPLSCAPACAAAAAAAET